MSKIKDLEYYIQAGARTNKYRILFPYLGREMDIQVHTVSSPGRTLGVSEVFLKGRKYQIAGDRGDSGTMSVTLYNDPALMIRKFFLGVINDVQSFVTPKTVQGSGPGLGLLGIPSTARLQMEYNLSNIGNLGGRNPWYQNNIRIQQMDHNDHVISETTLHNAFITEVGELEYSDAEGNISETTLTFAYTAEEYI